MLASWATPTPRAARRRGVSRASAAPRPRRFPPRRLRRRTATGGPAVPGRHPLSRESTPALKSSYLLVVAAEAGDEDALRAALALCLNARARWGVPAPLRRALLTRVLDKLNVLGALSAVWLDADVLGRPPMSSMPSRRMSRRRVNAGFRARTCFDLNGGRGAAFKCQTGRRRRRRARAALPVRAQFGGDGVVRPLGAAECVARRAAGAGGRGGQPRRRRPGRVTTPATRTPSVPSAPARACRRARTTPSHACEAAPKEWAAMARAGRRRPLRARQTVGFVRQRVGGARAAPRRDGERRRRSENGSTPGQLAHPRDSAIYSKRSL